MSHLVVKLGETPVGDLRRRSGDSWEFRFRSEYMDLPSRPVLGQIFEDDLSRIYRSTLRLPQFFSNLLPEGPLRLLVAQQAKVNEQREALLLEALGQDLPGAIFVEPGDNPELGIDEETPAPGSGAARGEVRLKFSLAGVQLKFSVLREGERLTLPVSGSGGDWIAKLPDARYPGVPANELSMLRWARASGIEVPDHELVDISSIDGLPRNLSLTEREALAVHRFDRSREGRIHQEDFAQVLSIYPDRKYDEYNYETIGNIVHAVAGPEALLEFIRRLVFVVLSGNGDAHHKNWSLVYPDGRSAMLSKAYDLVFTKAYIENEDLALNLRRSKRFEDVRIESFRRLARKSGFDEELVADVVSESAARIRATWVEVEPDLPLPREVKVKLNRHLDSIRL